MKFRLQAAAMGHALEQIIQGHAQGGVLKRARTQGQDGPARLSQPNPGHIAGPLDALCRFGQVILRNRAFDCLQLHDDASESLGESVVNVARHAISFCHDGCLAALLGKAC